MLLNGKIKNIIGGDKLLDISQRVKSVVLNLCQLRDSIQDELQHVTFTVQKFTNVSRKELLNFEAITGTRLLLEDPVIAEEDDELELHSVQMAELEANLRVNLSKFLRTYGTNYFRACLAYLIGTAVIPDEGPLQLKTNDLMVYLLFSHRSFIEEDITKATRKGQIDCEDQYLEAVIDNVMRSLQFVFLPVVKQATITAWDNEVTSMIAWLDLNRIVHEQFEKEITTEAVIQQSRGKKKATAFNLRLYY